MLSEIRTPADPVPVTADTAGNQILLKKLIQRPDLQCEIAADRCTAPYMSGQKKYGFSVSDLKLPVMNGKTFMRELRVKEPDAVNEVMKTGFFDYLIRSSDPDLFHRITAESCEYTYLRDAKINPSESAGPELRNQLEWLNCKESQRKPLHDSREMLSVKNQKASVNQNAGTGSMMTLADPARANAIKEPVIHSCRYTQEVKRTDIFRHMAEGFFCITVNNYVSLSSYGGVTQEMEKSVRKPFIGFFLLMKILQEWKNPGLVLCKQ